MYILDLDCSQSWSEGLYIGFCSFISRTTDLTRVLTAQQNMPGCQDQYVLRLLQTIES